MTTQVADVPKDTSSPLTAALKSISISNAALAPALTLTLTGKFIHPTPEEIHLIVDREGVESLRNTFKKLRQEEEQTLKDLPLPILLATHGNDEIEQSLIVPPFIPDEVIEEIERDIELAGQGLAELQARVRTKAIEYISYQFYMQRCQRGFHGDQHSDWLYAEALVDAMLAMYTSQIEA